MELERRALAAGVAAAPPIEPIDAIFGWASRIDQYGVWRAYEYLDHTRPEAASIDERWVGDTLALLHHLMPLTGDHEPEWRWLGVYQPDDWQRWIDSADKAGKPWAHALRENLAEVLRTTQYLRTIYEHSTDHVVSHLDFGPWNVLQTHTGLVLIDWENAGPTTASAELGRVVTAFGSDDPVRMQRLVRAYKTACGSANGHPDDLFSWHLTQHMSGLTERIKISLGDMDPGEDLEPAWMNAATIDADIIDAVIGLHARATELATLAAQVRGLAHTRRG